MQVKLIVIAVYDACQQIGHEWRVAQHLKRLAEKNAAQNG